MAFFLIGVGATVFVGTVVFRMPASKTRDIKALDELPVRALIKYRNMDLYYLEKMKCESTLRDLHDLRHSTGDYTSVKQGLLRLRRSPCFDMSVHATYTQLWELIDDGKKPDEIRELIDFLVLRHNC